jgi:hypothetical protein
MPHNYITGCLTKRAYPSEAEAKFPGQDVYFCLFCGEWHRTTPAKVKANFSKKRRQKYYERRIHHRSHQLRTA